MHLCGKLSRVVLLLANVILFIGSVGLLAVSLWSLVDRHYILVLLNESAPFWFSIVLFLLGCVTFTFAIVGCMGIVKHNKTMLVGYLILGVVLFVVTLSGGIICYLFREKADTMWHTDIIDKMERYDPQSGNAITKAFDEMQIELSCCGMENSDDWIQINPIYKQNESFLPSSCCTGGKRSQCSSLKITYFHELGCKNKLTYHIQNYCLIMGTLSTSLGFLLLMAVICCIGVYMELERNYVTKADI